MAVRKAASGYEAGMRDKGPENERQSRHIWVIGALGLAAWFAMLWLMFGDVL